MTRVATVLLFAAAITGCNPPPSANTGVSRAGTLQHSSEAVDPGLGESTGSRPESGRNRSRRSHPAANSQPGNFDFYLLALSWSPEFCATHLGSPECAAHPGFVVHGLWPQNNDGTYPEKCSNAPGPANPAQYTDAIPTTSLVEHEWTTHGTCSGLAADAYFGQIETAFHAIKIPTAFASMGQPVTEPPSAIIDQFAAANPGLPHGSVAISCGNNFLTAVEICLSKSLQPEACQSVRTCGATVVKVTPR